MVSAAYPGMRRAHQIMWVTALEAEDEGLEFGLEYLRNPAG